jgi:hypothetical protein
MQTMVGLRNKYPHSQPLVFVIQMPLAIERSQDGQEFLIQISTVAMVVIQKEFYAQEKSPVFRIGGILVRGNYVAAVIKNKIGYPGHNPPLVSALEQKDKSFFIH